jgi:hypothetical protein
MCIDREGVGMTVTSDRSSVYNSRPFDVHRWSDHPEVESFVAPLWHSFNAEQPIVIGSFRDHVQNTG